MNRRTDTIRLATYVGTEFSIYTTDPHQLSRFARELLASGKPLSLNLRESAERAAQWN
jgi:hypothetical protein